MKMVTGYILTLVLFVILASCEKVVDLDLPTGETLPYIDAWITDQPGVQEIKFLKSVGYFDAKPPVPVEDAQISITDLTINKTYPFDYHDGAYRYDAGSGGIGIIGHRYKMSITYQGELFEATDEIKRVTTPDSIRYEYRKEDGEEKEGYYAELFATDLRGGTDYTWIRTYKNGALNTNAGEMVAIDGAYDEGISDGFLFIPPFREGITSYKKPYLKNDLVKVELRSLSKSSYGFLNQVLEQLYSGGLFSKILQNVPANVVNKKAGSKLKIYGWFGTVAETGLSTTIQ